MEKDRGLEGWKSEGFKESRIQGFKWFAWHFFQNIKAKGLRISQPEEQEKLNKLNKPEKPDRGLEGWKKQRVSLTLLLYILNQLNALPSLPTQRFTVPPNSTLYRTLLLYLLYKPKAVQALCFQS